ncbi:hypothetical protein OAK19_05180 [Aureispira]|nr:hypothetical protein [Aureispira sp.]
MNKSNVFFFLLTFIVSININYAQTHYYTVPDNINEDDYELSFDNIVSKDDYCKMAIKVTNYSLDFLALKEVKIEYKGERFTQNGRNKEFIIPPGKYKSYTLLFDEKGNYNVNKFDVNVNGLFLIPSDGKQINTPDFNLPASTNHITTDDFEITLKNLKKETKETVATFKVLYKGKAVGLVKPSNLVAVFKDKEGSGYANESKMSATKVLKRGDKCTIKAIFRISAKDGDMQFVPMQILWKNTFQTTQEEKLEDQQINFSLDFKK